MNTQTIISSITSAYDINDPNTISVVNIVNSPTFVSIIERWSIYFNQDAIDTLVDYIYEVVTRDDNSHTLEWKLEQVVIQSLILEANLDTSLVPPEFPTE